MKKSESIIEIAKALQQFQAEIKNPYNDATNPFYKSKYATLPDILDLVRPVLTKHGLSVIQDVETVNDKIKVSTLLIHISGEWIEQTGLAVSLDKPTAQGAGSAITYARRYMLSALCAISGTNDDDDGNAAEIKDKEQNKEPKAKEAQERLKKLPEDIKDGLRILEYNAFTADAFCSKFNYDVAKIKAEINIQLDMRGKK